MQEATEKELPTVVSLTAKMAFFNFTFTVDKISQLCKQMMQQLRATDFIFHIQRLYFILRSSHHSIAIDQIQFDR